MSRNQLRHLLCITCSKLSSEYFVVNLLCIKISQAGEPSVIKCYEAYGFGTMKKQWSKVNIKWKYAHTYQRVIRLEIVKSQKVHSPILSHVQTISIEHISTINNIIIHLITINCQFNKKYFPIEVYTIDSQKMPQNIWLHLRNTWLFWGTVSAISARFPKAHAVGFRDQIHLFRAKLLHIWLKLTTIVNICNLPIVRCDCSLTSSSLGGFSSDSVSAVNSAWPE